MHDRQTLIAKTLLSGIMLSGLVVSIPESFAESSPEASSGLQEQLFQQAIELDYYRALALKSSPKTVQPVALSGSVSEGALQPAVDSLPSVPVYKIQPGDKLAVNLFGEVLIKDMAGYTPDKSGTLAKPLPVLPDGSISLSPFGVVSVAGKTLASLNAELNQKLSAYYKFARITVSVAEPTSLSMVVLGQVHHGGLLTTPAKVSLSVLLTRSGGTTTKADLSRVMLRKADGELMVLDLQAHPELAERSIQQGDMVFIPQQRESLTVRMEDTEDSSDQTTLAVNVIGHVNNPATVVIKPGDSLRSALAKAEGLSRTSPKTKITLVRFNRYSGRMQKWVGKVSDLASVKADSLGTLRLEAFDTIIVD